MPNIDKINVNGTTYDIKDSISGYTNQNAFSNIRVGDTTVAADSTTDTLELIAGDNVTLTPDATNDAITISSTGNDHLNVLDFGVKNDGTNASDNTTILNTLIQTYGFNGTTNGKTLYFPDGTYLLASRSGAASDDPILVVPHTKPINFLLSPNAKLTTTSAVNGIIEIGESGDGITGFDGFPPVIIHGGIIDCTSATYGIVCWSGRPLVRIEGVVFQDIGSGNTGLWLGRSTGANVKTSGDAKVINCTFNGAGSGVECKALLIDSNDNEINNVRINGCKYGITQSGSTYYNDIHMTVTRSSGPAVDFTSTIGLDIQAGQTYLNNVYIDTFNIGMRIASSNVAVYCNNCIWYAYQNGSSLSYKYISITNESFPLTGYLSLVNCSMTHAVSSSNSATYNYIYLDNFTTAGRVYGLLGSNSIKIVNCNFNFLNVPLYDLARNICFTNKPITVRPFFVNMTANSYYPIAYICSTEYNSYRLKFDLTTVASGEIEFVYNNTLTVLDKQISVNGDNTFSLALINPTTHSMGADTTTWAYLCLVTSGSEKKLQGTYSFAPGGGANRISAIEYGGGSGDYNPTTMYAPITAETVVGTIPIIDTNKIICAQANDSEGSNIDLVADTMTLVPMTTLEYSIGSGFSINNEGGVQVANAGVYLIGASLYLRTWANTYRRGLHIFVGADASSATEVNATFLAEPVKDAVHTGAFCVTPKLVSMQAGDAVYMKTRVHGDAGRVYAGNEATFIFIEKVN